MNTVRTYKIRYNTNSTGDSDRWRLLDDNKEHLVSKVIVNGHTATTHDWIPSISNYKWHINYVGHCKLENNIAYITSTKEKSTLIRHILKTISYRILGTLTTVITAFTLGATIEVSTLLGVAELGIKPILYFLHERVWYKKIRINENHGR